MRKRRASLSRWSGAALAFLLMLVGSSAGAQVVAVPVVFLDERPVTVELASGRATFDASIRNTSATDQKPTLQVVDARSANRVLTLLGLEVEFVPLTARAGSSLAPGTNATARVTLTAPDGTAAGRYEGRLLVHGDTGPASTRTITIVVQDTTTQPSLPSAPSVDAALENYTVTQPSYWPSLTRSWPYPGPLVSVLIVTGLVVVAIALWRSASHPATTPAGVFLAALGLVLASSWLLPRSDELQTPAWALVILAAGAIGGAVVVSPKRAHPGDYVLAVLIFAVTLGAVALATQQAKQPVPSHTVASPGAPATGSLVHPDGTPARLVRADNQLRISGLRRAGTYKGAIDLDPASDKGNLKVTANVRDWFGYAIVGLGLGLLLATSIADWFKNRRAKAKADVALAEAIEFVGLVHLRASRPGPPPAHPPPPGFKAVTERLIALVRESLAADRVDEATTRIKALTDYGSAYDALLIARKQLAKDVEAVKRLAPGTPKGALADAENRLEQPDDLSDDRETKELLSALAADTKLDNAAIDALRIALSPLPGHRQWLEGVDTTNWTQNDKDTFTSNKTAFNEAVDALLAARGDTNIKTAATKFDTAFATMRAHAEAPKKPKRVRKRVTTDDYDAVHVTGKTRDRYIMVELPAAPVLMPPPTVVVGPIVLRRLGSSDSAEDPAPGEPLVLSVDVSVHGEEPVSLRHRWTFGDGSSSREELDTVAPGSATRLEQVHQYLSSGEVAVVFDARFADQPDRAIEPRELVIKLADESAASRARQAFVRDDRVMAAIAGVVAIGSGLIALYFSTADWGSAEHYLKAFVWGGLVSEGTKAVKAIAERVVPG